MPKQKGKDNGKEQIEAEIVPAQPVPLETKRVVDQEFQLSDDAMAMLKTVASQEVAVMAQIRQIQEQKQVFGRALLRAHYKDVPANAKFDLDVDEGKIIVYKEDQKDE